MAEDTQGKDTRRRLVMPEPIPDTPENVARALMSTPPKRPDEWDYVKAAAKAKRPPAS